MFGASGLRAGVVRVPVILRVALDRLRDVMGFENEPFHRADLVPTLR